VQSEALFDLLSTIPKIIKFATGFTTFKNGSPDSDAEGTRLVANSPTEYSDVHFRAVEVHETEENLVCPELGMTGNVDVTFVAETSTYTNSNSNRRGPTTKHLIPCEVSERRERALWKTRILAMNPAKWLQTNGNIL